VQRQPVCYPGDVMRRLAALAGLVALLGACTPAPGESGPAQPPPSPGGSAQAEEFDYQAYLEILQEASRTTRHMTEFPHTELVRVIAPQEQGQMWKSCLEAAGYAVTLGMGGTIGNSPAGLPPDQQAAFDTAEYVCFAQYPVDQTQYPIFGDEQIRLTYDYYVDTLAPCLTSRGFEVAEPPTWQAFRDTWAPDDKGGYTASDDTWFPYELVGAVPMIQEEWEALNAACPQNPTDEQLWGDELGR
jgi:hypothetical protein